MPPKRKVKCSCRRKAQAFPPMQPWANCRLALKPSMDWMPVSRPKAVVAADAVAVVAVGIVAKAAQRPMRIPVRMSR